MNPKRRKPSKRASSKSYATAALTVTPPQRGARRTSPGDGAVHCAGLHGCTALCKCGDPSHHGERQCRAHGAASVLESRPLFGDADVLFCVLFCCSVACVVSCAQQCSKGRYAAADAETPRRPRGPPRRGCGGGRPPAARRAGADRATRMARSSLPKRSKGAHRVCTPGMQQRENTKDTYAHTQRERRAATCFFFSDDGAVSARRERRNDAESHQEARKIITCEYTKI